MYLRIGKRIANAAAMSHAKVGEEGGRTTVTIGFIGDGGDRGVRLVGEEVETFLDAIPGYRPVREEA